MKIALAIIALIIAVGAALDTLLYKQEKVKFYNKMKKWVEVISKTSTPKIHILMIDKALALLNRLFDWKRKPIRSIFNSILISWFLTSLMFALGDIIGGTYKQNTYWHDILPWYPAYFVNYIFDLATIVFTIYVLNKIKGKNLFIAFAGISLDIAVAYFLAVLCLFGFGWSNQITENAKLGLSPAAHQPDYDKFLYNDEFLPFDNDSFKRRFGRNTTKKLVDSGIDENTVVRVWNKGGKWQLLQIDNQQILKSIIYTFTKKRKPIIVDVNMDYSVNKKEQSLEFNMQIGNALQFPYAAMTTLIPTAIYTFILLLMYLSKEITIFSRWLILRVFKSAIQQGSPEKIEGFKPGLHFGVLLSVVVAFIELAIQLMDNS